MLNELYDGQRGHACCWYFTRDEASKKIMYDE